MLFIYATTRVTTRHVTTNSFSSGSSVLLLSTVLGEGTLLEDTSPGAPVNEFLVILYSEVTQYFQVTQYAHIQLYKTIPNRFSKWMHEFILLPSCAREATGLHTLSSACLRHSFLMSDHPMGIKWNQ